MSSIEQLPSYGGPVKARQGTSQQSNIGAQCHALVRFSIEMLTAYKVEMSTTNNYPTTVGRVRGSRGRVEKRGQCQELGYLRSRTSLQLLLRGRWSTKALWVEDQRFIARKSILNIAVGSSSQSLPDTNTTFPIHSSIPSSQLLQRLSSTITAQRRTQASPPKLQQPTQFSRIQSLSLLSTQLGWHGRMLWVTVTVCCASHSSRRPHQHVSSDSIPGVSLMCRCETPSR